MGKFKFKNWQFIWTTMPSLPKGPYHDSPLCSATLTPWTGHPEKDILCIHGTHTSLLQPHSLSEWGTWGHAAIATIGLHHGPCATSKSTQKNIVGQVGQAVWPGWIVDLNSLPTNYRKMTHSKLYSIWFTNPRNSTGWYSISATCCSDKILLKSQSLYSAGIVLAMTKARISPSHL